MPILRHASGSHNTLTFTPTETRHLPSPDREQAGAASGVITPISSSPPQNIGSRDGQAIEVGVVCCERVNRCLRQYAYIYIYLHRIPLAGKEIGKKNVGQWFGPSTATGAIKSLVQLFPDASIGISVRVYAQIVWKDVCSA
ncbi:hypothetical protein EI94DRAFT_869025 [Lactarius quietus]|nr:hypothetical protein EI94DRAFT_869025 [Lactarius quietus]